MSVETAPAESKASALKDRADAWQRSHPPAAFAYGVQKKFGDDGGSKFSALIAYYGFFSLFPLLMVLFTGLGYALADNPELQDRIRDSALSKIPLLNSVDISEVKGSGLAIVFGVLAALWAGLGATQVAQDAVNRVFGAPAESVPNFLMKRLRGLATLGVIGVGLAASTAVGSLGSALKGLGPAGRLGVIAATVVVNTGVVAGLFRWLGSVVPSRKALVWGAFVGGVAWTILSQVGGWYVNRLVDNASKTYGVFAVVIGLLSWIFLQARVFVYAAEITSVIDGRYWPRGIDDDDPTAVDLALRDREDVVNSGITRRDRNGPS